MKATSPLPLRVEPARPADMAAIGRLGAMLVRLHHDFDPERFISPDSATPQGYADYLLGELERPDVVILAAHSGDAVIGYVYAAMEGTDYMSLRGPAGVIHDLMVDPAHRGQGAGWRLLDAVLAKFRTRRAPRIVLSTAYRNERARAFFEKAGFRPSMVEMTREADESAPRTGDSRS
ncbi:GNAT family N-acetyltransferase [Aureimonas sp. ME7]|uniref:GNAT family N-acetyltransferase n=1 Tax=Aureimonas sp. ME7 TaxID=2744252 RepID=UPI0015F6A847|nr:GNAT family N-acetyltransferase [Aureimonas sp. ME7]